MFLDAAGVRDTPSQSFPEVGRLCISDLLVYVVFSFARLFSIIRVTFKSAEDFCSKTSSLLVFLWGKCGIPTFGQSSRPAGLGLRRGWPRRAVRPSVVGARALGWREPWGVPSQHRPRRQPRPRRFYRSGLPPNLSVKRNQLDFFNWGKPLTSACRARKVVQK